MTWAIVAIIHYQINASVLDRPRMADLDYRIGNFRSEAECNDTLEFLRKNGVTPAGAVCRNLEGNRAVYMGAGK